MLTLFHRLRRDEEGQTLVLGAISMLVLALAVMTTISIGHAAYEKIQLQNTADATAYSLAAVQARCFNFFAYTNRAMVAHYNTALTLVAFLSYAIYLQNTLGRLVEILSWVPPIAPVFRVIDRIIETVMTILRLFLKFALPIINALNAAYFLFQLGMWAVMQAQLFTEPAVASENDPDVITGINIQDPGAETITQALIKLLNAYMVNKGIDYLSMLAMVPMYGVNRNFDNVKNTNSPQLKNSQGQEKGNEGRLVMNEIVNAGRHEWVVNSKDGIEFLGRRWYFPFEIPVLGGIRFTKGARTEHGVTTGMGVRQNSRHDQLFSVEELVIRITLLSYWFQVEYQAFLIADYKRGGEVERIQITDKDCGLDPVCHGAKTTTEPIRQVLNAAFRGIPGLFTLKERQYLWFGLTPFMKFKPAPKWRASFNQPQYMVLAIKKDENLNPMTGTVHQKFGMNIGVDGSGFDEGAVRGEDGVVNFEIDVTQEGDFLAELAPGFNALAVSRAYYHRPGDWKEHPNFFNPFWAAKLDPVAHHSLLFEVPHLANFADEIILH